MPPTRVESTGVPQAIASSTAHGLASPWVGRHEHVGLLLEARAAAGRMGSSRWTRTPGRSGTWRGRHEVEVDRRARAPAERREQVLAALLGEAPADEQHARRARSRRARGPVALEVEPGMVLDHVRARVPSRSTPRRAQPVQASTSAARRSARRSSARLGAIVDRAWRSVARQAGIAHQSRTVASTRQHDRHAAHRRRHRQRDRLAVHVHDVRPATRAARARRRRARAATGPGASAACAGRASRCASERQRARRERGASAPSARARRSGPRRGRRGEPDAQRRPRAGPGP